MTGFLLAGVGNVDLRKKSNYLVVNESKPLCQQRMFKKSNSCVHPRLTLSFSISAETTVKAIEDAFREFTGREVTSKPLLEWQNPSIKSINCCCLLTPKIHFSQPKALFM